MCVCLCVSVFVCLCVSVCIFVSLPFFFFSCSYMYGYVLFAWIDIGFGKYQYFESLDMYKGEQRSVRSARSVQTRVCVVME